MKLVSGILTGCVLLLSMCGVQSNRENDLPYTRQDFKDYWYTGKAEVSSYELNENRYGESRPGKAVLIFVTEDFSKKKMVKIDAPELASTRDRVSVMKMNMTKNFVTGIYPYSLMQSTFTPVQRDQNKYSLKATMSSQEWCGQVFSQINLRGNRHVLKWFSYFEKEGDETESMRHVILEDELMNVIRIDYRNLPVGKFDLLPGMFHTRLRHMPAEPMSATATLTEGDTLMRYELSYDNGRRLLIEFDRAFPHHIERWTETWIERGKTLQSSAHRIETLHIDYWTKNKNEFQFLRDSLQLDSRY